MSKKIIIMDYEKLFTVRESAQRLKIKEATLRQMIRDKDIIAYKVGKRWLLLSRKRYYHASR